ncbi:C10 family peptidase [Dyadobacter sp. CY343]|uniref:C10 family peptidase n=1 Tax=Dyadobacter sp. CY343 TaxID=2907299 RepID=UPI001F3588E3|nr:C10 family peptidase [Dyadobacter sp. CY343]MCE7060533.1 C10 family peptidase [Dyadobacter sp. CY343]
MKLKILLPSLFAFSAALILFNGCSKDDLSEPSSNEHKSEKNQFFLDQEEAIELMSGEPVEKITSNARIGENKVRVVKEARKFYGERGELLFYIIEYVNDEGFTILSADKRMKPILAFSETGSFNEKTDNPGIQLWFDIIRENFEGAQTQKEAHIDIVNMWQQLRQTPHGGRTSDQPVHSPEASCEWFVNHPIPANSTIAHLTASISTWSQGRGYNAFCPVGIKTLNCKASYPCDNAPTGCGPVAVAQVLRFHRKPITANAHAYSAAMFNAMPITAPDNCVPVNVNHTNLAQLIRDTGKDLDAVYNTLVPALGIPLSGSGCQTWNIPGHIDNFFSNRGYTSFDKEFFSNEGIVSSELRANRPVIVFGSNCAACAAKQHIWIMDGIRDLYAIFNDQNGFCYENHAIYYQMNWGWGAINENNTWFAYNGIVGGGTLYNSSNMRAYIVHP